MPGGTVLTIMCKLCLTWNSDGTEAKGSLLAIDPVLVANCTALTGALVLVCSRNVCLLSGNTDFEESVQKRHGRRFCTLAVSPNKTCLLGNADFEDELKHKIKTTTHGRNIEG